MQKMEQFNIRMEKKLIEDIDRIVESDGSFNSRSNYIRTRLREDIMEDKKWMMDEYAVKIGKIILERGAKPGLITQEEKKQIADEFLREKGLK